MFKDLGESEKKVLKVWGSIALVLMIGLTVAAIMMKLDNTTEEAKKGYAILQDSTRYYTAANALNKYYAFVNAKDADSVLKILADDYKKDNNITKDNVMEKVGYDKNVSVTPGYMCFYEYKTGVVEYIFKGTVKNMNKADEILDEKYYRVILDGNNMTFSVEQITEKYFGGKCK